MRAAAVQTATILADVDANLAECERLADEAARDGADWIMLPEFFTTGMGFDETLTDCVFPPDGTATQLLLDLAKRHDATVGGSFLCLDEDGHVRNAFFLATPDGIAGRHDKDIPSMWENCFYVGGTDDGIIPVGEITAGVGLCLEFNRSQTVKRLRGKVDVVVGGSCRWNAPKGTSASMIKKMDSWVDWIPTFARLVGTPVVDAAHSGRFRCPTPVLGTTYSSSYRGGASICDAQGNILGWRAPEDGSGVVVADITPGRVDPTEKLTDDFWIQGLDPMTKYLGWKLQGWHGRRWYDKNGAGSKIRA